MRLGAKSEQIAKRPSASRPGEQIAKRPPACPGEGPGVRGQSPREEKMDDFALKMAIFPSQPGESAKMDREKKSLFRENIRYMTIE